MKNRIREEAPVRKDGDNLKGRASVPVAIGDALGARIGDRLVFEEGCETAVQRALLRGGLKYFVVYLERAPEPAVSEETLGVLEEHQYLATASGIVKPPELESFAEAVKKKQEKR